MNRRAQHIAHRRRLVAKLRRHRKAVTWLGVAFSAAGVAIIAFPAFSPLVAGALAGWLLWFTGATMLMVTVVVGAEKSYFGALVAGLAASAAGAFLLFNPAAGALAATLLIAAVLILDGAFELALALDLRPLAAWRWVLASSIASVMAGIIVSTGAGGSQRLVAALLGLAFASTGVALLALARTRRAIRAAAPQRGVVSRSPSTSST